MKYDVFIQYIRILHLKYIRTFFFNASHTISNTSFSKCFTNTTETEDFMLSWNWTIQQTEFQSKHELEVHVAKFYLYDHTNFAPWIPQMVFV